MLTSGIGAATRAVTWWGCTALTWDPYFPRFVSADPEEAALGAFTTEQALPTVDTDTVINLDAFTVDMQQRIVRQLGRGKCSRWVLFSNRAGKANSGARRLLAKVGTLV